MTSKNHCIPRLRTLPADDPTGQDSCRQAVILIVANQAYGCKTCRVHGARKPATILKGKHHPAYKDGSQTLDARADYSAAASRLRTLEQLMVDTGTVSAEFRRTVGRKPRQVK